MIKLIIFDVDGTMIDTKEAVLKSYRYAISQELGRQFTESEETVMYGIPTSQAMELLGVQDIEGASKRYYESLFRAYEEGVPLFEGIVPVLEELIKRNIFRGIVTSRDRREMDNDSTLKSIMKYFDYVICAEDTEKHKPDPEPVNKLLELAGVDASDAIYIGDTVYDYMCAKGAGVRFALATWGASPDENINEDYTLEKPEDLLLLI